LSTASHFSLESTETMSAPLDSTAIANYLSEHPEFFQEHGALLAQIQLSSPLTGRAISLQERQMEVMRSKYKTLELRLAEFIRTAHENEALNQKFNDWSKNLLLARNDVDLPHVLIDGLRSIFNVPYATLRLWDVASDFSHTWFVKDVSEDIRIFANSLTAPYCGINNDFEVVTWIEDGQDIRSVAMLPLRLNERGTFGLLVLGSSDENRFAATMATDFLLQISTTSSAALACLLD
jgi:uncharacterized protein YigA (DUF484 family)